MTLPLTRLMTNLFLISFTFSLLTISSFANEKDEDLRPWLETFKNVKKISFSIPELNESKTLHDIPVYYIENNLLPKVEISIIFEGGVVEEEANKAGITSLWGKLLTYSGSVRYPRDALARILENNAASISFNASLERSAVSLTSLKGFFNTGLMHLFDLLYKPRFAEADLKLLKKQLILSIKKRKENPGRLAYQIADTKYWQDSVRAQISTIASINSIGIEDIRAWHKKMLQAQRIKIAISGDFKMNNLKIELNNYLAKLKNQPLSKSYLSRLLKKPVKQNQKIFYFEKNIPQTTLLMKAKGLSHNHPDYLALKIVNFILGGDTFNSHLMQQIRVKRGWAYSTYSYFSAERDLGTVSIFAQSANKNIAQLIPLIENILDHPSSFINQKRIEAAKRSMSNKFVFLYETPAQLLDLHLALKWHDMPKTYLDNYLINLNKVTLEEVLRVAQTYYGSKNFMTVLVGPSKSWQLPKSTIIEAVDLPD